MSKKHLKPFTDDVAGIKLALAEQLYDLLQELYGHRKITSKYNDWRVGNNEALWVTHEGNFHDHDGGAHGDIIDLIQYALAVDFKSALVWAKWFLGLRDSDITPRPKCKANNQPQVTMQPVDAGKRTATALSIWRESRLMSGTLAEVYLVSRGIKPLYLESLRFHEKLWNHTSQRNHPALVAAIQGSDGKIQGVQCIFLDEVGRKIIGDGVKAKLIYGLAKGGAVRLAPLTSSLILCEGIEDGLSILQSCPDSTVWACLGTSGLVNVVIPETTSHITIAADADEAGQKAAQKLAARLIKEGKSCRIAYPPSPFKDFNEARQLQAGGVA